MKIGMNALFFQYPATGSGQYMTHLLSALAEIDSQNEYVLLGPGPVETSLLPFPYHVHPVPTFAASKRNMSKVVWEQFTAPSAARKEGVDIFHVPYFAPPLFPRTATVVTLPDVIPLHLPAYRPDNKVKAYMNLVSRAARYAKLVITVSQHARQDIIDTLQLPAERVRVIYEAAGKEYQPVTDNERLAAVCKSYGLKNGWPVSQPSRLIPIYSC